VLDFKISVGVLPPGCILYIYSSAVWLTNWWSNALCDCSIRVFHCLCPFYKSSMFLSGALNGLYLFTITNRA